jgi:cytochrome P450
MNAPVDVDLKARAFNSPLEDLDPSDPRIYYEDVWQPYFERFRREAPVHRVKDSPYGPYWSVAKYKDIIQVEVNHKIFSSSDEVGGIMINDAPKGMERKSFIRMDPPEHDEQRREVSAADVCGADSRGRPSSRTANNSPGDDAGWPCLCAHWSNR